MLTPCETLFQFSKVRHKRCAPLPSLSFGYISGLHGLVQTVAKLNEILSENGGASTIEMTSWLSRTALDAIGEGT